MTEPITESVGKCVKCNVTAQWNTPLLDEDGKLHCETCGKEDRTGMIFRGIKQFTENGQYIHNGSITLNGVVVHDCKATWTNGGSRSVKLTEEEQKLSPMDIAILINDEHNVQGWTRCSSCGLKMKKEEIAGYPLFAGVCCAPCMGKHKQQLEEERKKGYVCRMCGQPYSNCCC